MQRIMVPVVLLFACGLAAGDSISTGTTTANALKLDNVKITGMSGDQIQFATASGTQKVKPLVEVQMLSVDGESALNAGEAAFADRKWDAAIAAYQTEVASGGKDWMKVRAASRLVQAAKVLHRFDAEVAGYVVLVKLDPAAAAVTKPAAPAETTPNLDAAASTLEKSASDSTLAKPQKSALIGLQLDVYRAQKDSAKVTQTLKQLSDLGGATPAELAMLKLAAANVALDAKNYVQAFNDVEQNRQLFADKSQQVDALFTLAQARAGMDAAKTDSDTLKDLAVAYMRVVTFGSDLADHPHVAELLVHAGELEEKLNEPKVARQLYQKAIKERSAAGTPAAAAATAALAKLGGAGPDKN